MQFLGLFGILKQSLNLIYTFRKIFTQITLSLILPLSFIFLAHMEISHIMLFQLISNESSLLDTQKDSMKYKKLSDLVTTEFIEFFIFKFLYFTILIILSLLSTSAVVYTVASSFASREINFKKVMSVVPRVWKRLMVTFLCIYIAMFLYNFCSILVIILCDIYFKGHFVTEIIVILILLIMYLIGLVYLSLIWQLASVVSVLEESFYGLKAVVKGKNLLKGKLVVPGLIFLVLNILVGVLQRCFDVVVVNGGREYGMVERVWFGILILVLLLVLLLFWLVVQTVIYFVCKSYHHEIIDKSLLSEHLDFYLGEYVPLKARDVQLESMYV